MPYLGNSKASSLLYLKERIRSAQIAPLIVFTVADWRRQGSIILGDIDKKLNTSVFIVRSSCSNEDTKFSSNAGAFLSLKNVRKPNLANSIDKVIASYGRENQDDQIIVQPMLANVIRSGVAFTHDPNTCSPYRIINYSEGPNTSAITSGKTIGKVWQQAALSPIAPPSKLVPIIKLLEELLQISSENPIDAEFAVTNENGKEILWLLQARPLILRRQPESSANQAVRLKQIAEKISHGMHSHPFLHGNRTVYGIMPDWNPAEMIGIRPKPLALSLYREIITDNIWAYQRHNYGYRNLRSFPLMLHFFGLPYIDVRLSFNSFIPENLPDKLASKLVDYYVSRLLNEPSLHDKVEFEIVFSSSTLDLTHRLNKLSKFGFSRENRAAIACELRNLTNNILDPKFGMWRKDLSKLDVLEQRRAQLLNSNVPIVEKIYWLLEDLKRYGTLPFAGLARMGFIAMQMLKSMITTNILTETEYDLFMGSIRTISSQMVHDRTSLDEQTFLKTYGHLRPGTYDILSKRYDEASSLYFDWDNLPNKTERRVFYEFTEIQTKKIDKFLNDIKLSIGAEKLIEFIKQGIEARELSKFRFTRNLSDILHLITEYGIQKKISREDLSYIEITTFKELFVGVTNDQFLFNAIEQGKIRYNQTLNTALPPVISSPDEVWSFSLPESAPNYITQNKVTGPVVSADNKSSLANAIVCIPTADPGFDWLLAHPIGGLITAWGGINSHMAIRASELGLPAVIGAGQMFYQRWSQAAQNGE